MEDYKSNSHAVRDKEQAIEKKKVEKVVTGTVTKRKKTELGKLKDNFISDDAANIKSYVIGDVLIPALKKAISDIVTNGIDMILYPNGGNPNRKRSGTGVSYDRFYGDKKESCSSSTTRARTLSGYSFDDIVIPSRGEAEDVLTRMDELIGMYGMVSVGDLYDLVGITGNYTDNKYGWTNIRNAEPVRVRDGYILRLPKALPL